MSTNQQPYFTHNVSIPSELRGKPFHELMQLHEARHVRYPHEGTIYAAAAYEFSYHSAEGEQQERTARQIAALGLLGFNHARNGAGASEALPPFGHVLRISPAERGPRIQQAIIDTTFLRARMHASYALAKRLEGKTPDDLHLEGARRAFRETQAGLRKLASKPGEYSDVAARVNDGDFTLELAMGSPARAALVAFQGLGIALRSRRENQSFSDYTRPIMEQAGNLGRALLSTFTNSSRQRVLERQALSRLSALPAGEALAAFGSPATTQ